jgi:hypothetical protein
MLHRIVMALAAASLFGAASIPTDTIAAGRGGGGHGGFGRRKLEQIPVRLHHNLRA